jgi:hypothetical protein
VMQNLLVIVAGAVWCLIVLLLIVGAIAIIKLQPRTTTTPLTRRGSLPKAIVPSLEKFRGSDFHSEPLMPKVLEKHREPPNAFISSRWEDAHFVSRVQQKRVAEPKKVRDMPARRTYSLGKRYNPAVPTAMEQS